MRPAAFLVVLDRHGFVGAFSSRAAAAEGLRGLAPPTADGGPPFVGLWFRAEPGPAERVWVVPYAGCDAVACVSNRRERAAAVLRDLAAVGLAYDEDVDCWAHPVDEVQLLARGRLEAARRGAGAVRPDGGPAAERKEVGGAEVGRDAEAALLREIDLGGLEPPMPAGTPATPEVATPAAATPAAEAGGGGAAPQTPAHQCGAASIGGSDGEDLQALASLVREVGLGALLPPVADAESGGGAAGGSGAPENSGAAGGAASGGAPAGGGA